MDVLEQFLSGGKTTQPPSAGGTISEQLLDSLERVESGKDRFAINKDTKAMGPYQFLPETVQMLHKQGIEFNPFNRDEARAAAKSYLEQLVKKTGSVDKALAAYGGFVTKDPTAYVQKVTQGKSEPVALTDPLEAFLSGKPITKTEAPAPTATQADVRAIDNQIAQPKVKSLVGDILMKAAEGRQAMQEMVRPVYEVGGTLFGGAAGSVLGPVAGVIETLQSGKYGTREGAEIGRKKAEAVQRGLVPEVTTPAAQAVLGTLGKAFEASKLPPVVMPELAGVAPLAVPSITQSGQAVGRTAQAVTRPIREAAKELEIVRPGQMTKAEAEAQFAAMQGKPGSAGAAAATGNPFAGTITGEEAVRGQFPQVKLSKTPTDVPINEQSIRSKIIQEIMPGEGVRLGVITGNESLLRNEHTRAKLGDTPENLLFKEQIAKEQAALSRFAEERVNATGASPTLLNDEQRGIRINDVMHGVSPDDMSSASITGYLNQAKKEVYKSAFDRVGNNQIKTTHVDDLLQNPQWAAGLKIKGVEGVQSAAKEYLNLAKTVGFEDVAGVMHPPGSVAAYDAVRKALNAEWTPQNSRAIHRVTQAIDQDIAAVADPALYKLGDKIHQVEKTIFDSKGIKTLFGEVDKNGVLTSSTPLDKIPSKLNNLPKDQWRHIRDTLNELAQGRVRGAPDGMPPVPAELRQSAAAAVAEIDGALARAVHEAGAGKAGEWNQNSVNKVLNSTIGEKILETFPPEEVRKFHVLNYGGQIMPGGHVYEGAALQARRVGLIEKHAEKALTGAGTATGAAIGGPAGAAIGGYLAQKAGAKVSAKAAAKAETKALQKAQEEMRKAAELGKQTGKNKLGDLTK